MPLEWSESSHADRVELQHFTCAYPEKGRRVAGGPVYHPRPYQLKVQSYVRDYRPPSRTSMVSIVGRDEHGIVAFAEYEPPDETGGAWIGHIARENRVADAKVGSQILEEVLRRVKAAGAEYVETKIHFKNNASQRLARSFGFESTGFDGEYGVWTLYLGQDAAI